MCIEFKSETENTKWEESGNGSWRAKNAHDKVTGQAV